MIRTKDKISDLSIGSKLALFTISYSPLLLIMIMKTISANWDYFHLTELTFSSIKCFFLHFSWLTFLVILILFSALGLYLTLSNLNNDSSNGYHYKVDNVEDNRPESINYLATYIFPFVFEENNIINIISMMILFVLILLVTIRTSLIIVNPVLSIFMGIYTADICINSKTRHIYIISKDRNLEEKTSCKLYRISKKIYIEKSNI